MSGKYTDIFEFQDANGTLEEKKNALRQMSEDEVSRLIMTCGTVQGKIYYSKLYRETTGKKDFKTYRRK